MKIEQISLVVPCYNEADTLSEFHRRVLAVSESMPQRKFKFIYVNDGSTDETGSILNAMADSDSRVRVLHLAQNRGHQIALIAGIDHATGDAVVTIDGDLQDPPELINAMMEKLEQGFDIVHAQRFHRKGEKWFKIISARIFYRLLRLFSSTPIIENCGDFRAFTRPVRKTLNAFRSVHSFLRGTFVIMGFRQCVIQYDRNPRYAGKSKYPLYKMLKLSIDAFLGFSVAPIRLITVLSLFLWSVSLVYLAKALIEHFFLKITITGWTSIIALIIFSTGLILFSIAIIGSYVGRIFIQSQNQPLYWLCDARNIDYDQNEYRTREVPEVRLSHRIIANEKKDGL